MKKYTDIFVGCMMTVLLFICCLTVVSNVVERKDSRKKYHDFFEQKRFVGFVYEENEEVLGCIFALRKISGSKEEIYINEMAVLPERQGQGIGKQLLNTVKDYSKDKGLAGIVLYTSEYAPAAKFYEKNGFQLSNGTICMYCE